MKKLKEVDMRRVIVMAIAVLLSVSPAFGADEDPCADEVGAGYGLCNAYCVAMNCADATMQEASDSACDRVLANYIKITGNETIPCEEPAPACPCFSAADVRDLIAWTLNYGSPNCSSNEQVSRIIYGIDEDIGSQALISSTYSLCYFYYGDEVYIEIGPIYGLTDDEINSCREAFNKGTNNCDSGTINP